MPSDFRRECQRALAELLFDLLGAPDESFWMQYGQLKADEREPDVRRWPPQARGSLITNPFRDTGIVVVELASALVRLASADGDRQDAGRLLIREFVRAEAREFVLSADAEALLVRRRKRNGSLQG